MYKREKAWLVRGVPHGEDRVKQFYDENFIAIGWPQIGDLTNATSEQIQGKLSNKPYCYKAQKLGVALSAVNHFVNVLDIGDYVLLPDDNDIYLGVISSNYIYNKLVDTEEEGYPHQRKVEWKRHILREELPYDLRNSLKARNTIANLSAHFSVIDSLINGEKVVTSLELMNVEYPLRPNQNISLQVPQDMTKQEAERLGKYIATLYFTE